MVLWRLVDRVTGRMRRAGRVGRRVRTVEAAAVAGIAYAALTFATRAILFSVPSLDDPDVVEWFNDENNQELLLLALNLTSIATVSFLWFVAVIRRRIGAREDQFFSTVFVGSGIFKSGDPSKRADAIVKATTHYNNPEILAEVSRNLGEPMVGRQVTDIPESELLAGRGW